MIDVSVEPGDADVLGMGQLDIFETEIAAGEILDLTLSLEAGTVFSVAAIAPQDDPDLVMDLIGPDGALLVSNDDHETADLLVGDFDPKIERFTAPTSGEYQIDIYGFGEADDGAFTVVLTRFGVVRGETETEVLTGESLVRQRNLVTFEAEAGELLNIVARADDSSLDPEITLLDPDMIVMAYNDDHDTEDETLGIFDARIADFIAQKSGTYTVDVTSVSGRGAFEVIVEHVGVIELERFEPFEPETAIERRARPTAAEETPEQPDIGPQEATEEPSTSSESDEADE
jgi:hypothetical protein